MTGDPAGTQDAPERGDHGAGSGPLQRGGGTLGAGPADVGVVEQGAPVRPGGRRGPAGGTVKAAGSGRMCATGGGPSGSSARRSRAGAQRAAGRRPTTSSARPATRPRGAGPGRWVDGTRATTSMGPPTVASSRPAWASRNARRSAAHDGAEALPGLGHRRLLVPEQDRVERARQRAEACRHHGRRAAGPGGGRPAGRRSRRTLAAGRRGRGNAQTPGPGRAPGRGQAAGAGSGRCRRKVPVARLINTPSASRTVASP